MHEFVSFLADPKNQNLWNGLIAITSVALCIGGFIGWLITTRSNNSATKTTRVLIHSIVELYLNWVNIYQKDKGINDESIRIWICDKGGLSLTGRSFLVFKKFIFELRRRGYKDIAKPDKEMYEVWITKFGTKFEWDQIEW